jgi:hypothetical protein
MGSSFHSGTESANLYDRSAGLHDDAIGGFRCHPLPNWTVTRDINWHLGAGC